MAAIRNIREFTVAISNKLMESNWEFTSSYSRLTGMTFLLGSELQGYKTSLNIIPDASTPNFLCQVILNNHLYKVFSYDTENRDIVSYLKDILEFLEKIRDCDIEINL